MFVNPRMPWPFSWYYYRKKAREYYRRFPGARLSAYSQIPAGNIKIGRGTYGCPTILTYAEQDKVEIGNYTSIGPEVMIVAGGNHSQDNVSTYPLKQLLAGGPPEAVSKGPVVIGHDVWLGARVIVLSGVTVGNGAVIAAGSVVAVDIPAYAVTAGVPARIIKHRFTQQQIEELENIAWWNWPEDKIIANLSHFYRSEGNFLWSPDSVGLDRG